MLVIGRLMLLTVSLAALAGSTLAASSRFSGLHPPMIYDRSRRDGLGLPTHDCGSYSGGDAYKATVKHFEALRRSESTLKARANESECDATPGGVADLAGGNVTIPVAWHVLTAGLTPEKGYIPEAKIVEQMKVVNKAFSPAGIAYEVVNITHYNYSDFSKGINLTDQDSVTRHVEFKDILNSRDAGVLDIYTTSIGFGTVGFVISYAAWYDPTNVDSPVNETLRGWWDGVVLDYQAVPGGPLAGRNLGQSLTHEIGHWAGLEHTFGVESQNTTGCSGEGDLVDDTPTHLLSQWAPNVCPSDLDTCPDQQGLDPVDNYMNYVDESCMTRFTEGQIVRMKDMLTHARNIQFD